MTDEPVIVIGSGPCGAVAAARLVERGVDVVMLDAGVRMPRGIIVKAGGNTILRRKGWADVSDDRHDPSSASDVDWISSLSLGGLSNYWTAAVPRFAPEDFDEGARLDERYRWPISYAELVPFYAAGERMLTITAGGAITNVPANVARFTHRLPPDWERIVATATIHGHGLGVLPMAKGRPWMVARRGTEFSSYDCVIVPMMDSPSFRLVTGAHVTRLNWSPSSGRVESVEYVDRRSGTVTTRRGRAVVVAAGAIDSTTLLLRSTSSDFPDGLGNSSGVLGRYLHDHPREWWTARSEPRLSALSHPVYIARAKFGEGDPLMATSLTLGLAGTVDRLRSFYRGRTAKFGVQVFGTMVPLPDAGVELRGDPDPVLTRPKITLRYDGRTIDNLHGARERLQDILRCADIAVDIPGPFHDIRPGSSVHYGGTVRMHADRRFGVLDRWNRMHDVPNVVVSDSSCFPTGPEKNPTLTAMAIAIRAADRLALDLAGNSG